MVDRYLNSDTGSDSNGGTGPGDAWQTLAHARANSGDDDRWILAYADGTPYVVTSQLSLSSVVERLVITGMDSAGVIAADDPATFNRDEKALIENNHSGDLFNQSHADPMGFHGLIMDGVSQTGNEAYVSTTTGATATFELCEVRQFNNAGIRGRNMTIRECWIHDIDGPGITLVESSPGLVVESSIISECTERAIEKFNVNYTVVARNVTIYRCSFTHPIEDPDNGNTTLQNVLIVDTVANYGMEPSTWETGNSYTSDAGTYHLLGNYDVGATDPSNDLELDPQFEDADAGDFRINNATLISGGTSNSVPRLYDGTAMPSPPPIGALGAAVEPATPPDPSLFDPTEGFLSAFEMGLAGVASTSFGFFPPRGEWSGESISDLEAAVFLSLFSDARVERHELPVGDTDLRGFWGDTFPEVENDVWGGKLWLSDRGKLTAVATADVDGAFSPEQIAGLAYDALAWMIEDGVASSIETTAELRDDGNGVELVVTIVRERTDETVTFRYDLLWESFRNG